MTIRRLWFVILGFAGLAACSGETSLRCEDSEHYLGSTSAPPVRVPDGLTVPDESQALEIPPGEMPPIPDEDTPPDCLELPPDFFEAGATPASPEGATPANANGATPASPEGPAPAE